MHVLLLFHHSFVVKVGHPVSVKIVCQNHSFSVQYVHSNASFEIDIMWSPSSTFKGLTPIQWKDLRLSYRAQLAHCKEGQTHDLYCNCNMHIACNCGRRSRCFQDKNFPILDCQSLAQSIAISCNLLQSYSQQDIKWPARQISHIFTASVQPIYCGSLAEHLLWQPC